MSIADQIRQLKADIDAVYEAGKAAGGGDNYYDEFWGLYQENGNRKDYKNAFQGTGWSPETFKPKFIIQPTNASSMFSGTYISGSLVELLESRRSEMYKVVNGEVVPVEADDILLDFSKASANGSIFNGANYITELGVIDATAFSNLSYTFSNMKALKTIQLLKLKNTGKTACTSAFSGCESLENITIEGVIGYDNFNFQWSTKLSKTSIESILSCLSTTTSGLTVTLSLEAVNKAYETSAGALDGSTSDEWKALVAVRSNWTISLI